MFVVLFGFAGLALDAGHIYLVARNVQKAADAGVLAAGKGFTAALQSGPPASSTTTGVQAAHDWTAANGLSTIFNSTCDKSVAGSPRPGLTQFQTTWYDTAVPCGATSGFNTSVSVYAPPKALTPNCSIAPYNCVQIVVRQQVANYLIGVLGQPVTTVSAAATAYAQPANGAFSVPAPVALYLYQPQAGCNSLNQQCFDETKPPLRLSLSCKGVAPNCPTFWVRPGSNPLIKGIDGNILTPPTNTVAAESNGDVVLQDATGTTICDPDGGAACTAGTTTGSLGFAINGATLYCSGFGGGSTSNTTPPCTTTGLGGATLGPLDTNETAFSAQTWTPSIDTSGLAYCAALVLNGDTVNNSFVGAPAPACQGTTAEPYTIRPGRYDYIVINHGSYDFEGGLYEITNVAPVNTNATGFANGIDHSTENAATDWDLCTAGTVLGCGGPSPLTAGIWIGHGSLSYTPVGGGGSVGTCDDGSPQIGQTGGGDPTVVTANGTLFRFDGPLSGGFVSTHEVTSIAMVGPAQGSITNAGGTPLLFDLENDAFIHLDSSPTTNSYFKGLIYQTVGAKAGGVEVNPGLAGGNSAAIGQVWAYGFTTFGTGGIALDFSKGFGGASSSSLLTSGDQEQEILTSAALVAPSPPKPGFQTLEVHYDDEWKLDAYTAYVKINTGNPVFFSQGIWNPIPPAGAALPPAVNNPGDSNPAYPVAAQDSANNYVKTTDALGKPDWTMTYSDGSTFRINGDWAWGHEESIPGAVDGSDDATLRYTFPIPPGGQVTVTLFMADGDSCGDFATATWTFNNIAPPLPGPQTAGTVRLEQ